MGRGASLSFLSQYPKEEEILIPPRSYLEVVGPSRIETGAHGLQIRSAWALGFRVGPEHMKYSRIN